MVEREEGAETEFGRWLFAQACDFVTGAAQTEQFPPTDLPEIAFAGRSNVGKSSLINALTGRRALARTSNTPGRTQQINFFSLGAKLMIADLPGYGFARAPREAIRQWTELIGVYLRGRAGLRRVCLLIDARHGLKESDREIMELMDGAAVSYQVVLTKADKITGGALDTLCRDMGGEIARRPAAHPEIMASSAREKQGIPELRAALAALVSRLQNSAS
jgi:GTP-binding protein